MNSLFIGWIDEYPENNNFIVFDIESSLTPSNAIVSEKQTIIDDHNLLSIAVHSFVNGEHVEKVWTISETSDNARMDIVKEFLMFCNEESKRMEVDQVMIIFLFINL